MSSNSDFVIGNGVLMKYNGPGGEVVIPESVTRIGRDAFYGCTGLTGVIFHEKVIEIRKRAFTGCTRLAHIEIPNGNPCFFSKERLGLV